MNARPMLFAAFVLAVIVTTSLVLRLSPSAARADPPKTKAQIRLEDVAKQLEEMSARAKEHDLLEALAGSWNVEGRVWTDPPQPNHPGQPPLVAHGTMKCAWVLGKRFMRCEAQIGQTGELRSESMTMYGYDTRTKKYTVVGFDSFGTTYVQASGRYDEESKALTLEGTNTENDKTMPFRWVVSLGDKDRVTQEVLLGLQPGRWVKIAEARSTRSASQ